jgi:hypothetical protein
MGLMAGVTGRQGMLTPPKHLIPPLVYPEVRVCPILKFVSPTYEIDDFSLFMLFHYSYMYREKTSIYIYICAIINDNEDILFFNGFHSILCNSILVSPQLTPSFHKFLDFQIFRPEPH